MTGPAVARVDIGSLTLGRALGTGGQGSVTAVEHFLISRQWNAVLKTYSPAAAASLRPAVLEKVVAFPRELAPADSRWLHEHTAWPAVIVQDNDVVSGFLMRAVPAACSFGFRTQTQGIQPRLADVAFLLNPDDYLARAGLTVDDQGRLALLTAIADTLSRLHALGVVIGDLSPKNLLFSSGASPRCFVIDCDTVRLHGETVLDQVDTPDWESPEGEPRGTVATDAYKFGLLAIRLFARDQSSRDESALAALSPPLGRLAERSLHDDPAQRPSPQHWLPALEAARSTAPLTTPQAAPPATPQPSPAQPSPALRSPALPAPVVVPADTVSPHGTSPARNAPSPQVPAIPAHEGPAPRRRGAKVTLAAAVVLVILATVAGAVLVLHKAPGPASASDPPGTDAGQSATATATSPAPSDSPDWTTYTDPGQFSIMLPAGWSVSYQSATEVDFTGQPAGFTVLVAWTTHPQPDAYTDWVQQAASKAKIDPTYRQISIQPVNYRGYNAADWEFVNQYRGMLTHVVDRGFIVDPGQLGYAIELYGPDSGYAPVYAAMWNKLVSTFELASSQ